LWQTAGNWTGGVVPGANDDAIITSGSGSSVTVSAINPTVKTVTCNKAFILDNNVGFTVTAGASSVSGALTLNPGTALAANGSTATFTATGTATIDGASLYAANGGQLTLPSTSYVGRAGSNSTLQADGTNSVLDLSHITTLTGASNYSYLYINGQNNGHVKLNGVTSVPAGTIGVYASGASGQVNLSHLSSLHSDASYHSYLWVNTGGSILVGALTTLNRADLRADATTWSVPGITSLTDVNLWVYSGGGLTLAGVTS
jgi:hypothetical protein